MKRIFKFLYSLIPFKKGLFSLVRMFWSPKPSVYQHLHFKGTIRVPVPESKSFKIRHYGYQIENEIFWAGLSGGWEKESIKVWIKLCKNSGTIFDIGANTGIYSLVAKAVNPSSVVYAFEPVSRVFKKLKKNIELNHYDIYPVQKAVSNFDGKAVIYDRPSDHIYSVTVNKNLAAPDTEVIETTISTISLDSFIRKNAVSGIDLLKIDVETHEPEVLKGFSEYLKQYKPAMLIEILNEDVGEKINTITSGLDYLYFNIDEERGVFQESKITKSNYYNYLVCQKEVAEKIGLITEGDRSLCM